MRRKGKENSLNIHLLNRIVENLSGDRPTIVPAGGKFTLSVFAQGYFSPNEVENQRYLVFRDRDFDICPTENIRLLEMRTKRGNIFAFSIDRSCVENYLLCADFIYQYWSEQYLEKQDNPNSTWGYGDSPGVERLDQWIEDSAKTLKPVVSLAILRDERETWRPSHYQTEFMNCRLRLDYPIVKLLDYAPR